MATPNATVLQRIVADLRKYDRVIVTGPQRAGTTIAARILAGELGYRFVPEEQVGVASVERLFELYRSENRFVVQGPCFCPYVHLLPGAVVLMRRPVDQILRSQARIKWSEKDELDRYLTTQGPIAQVKYDAWDRFQRPLLRERAFELDYDSLAGHALWIEQEQRRNFGARQISSDSPDEAVATLERDLQLDPGDAEREHQLGNALRVRGRLRGAVSHLQQALRLKPNFPEAYYHLAQAFAEQGLGQQAILCFRQAVRLKPDFGDAHRELGNALRLRADTPVDEAAACYREAIRLNADDAEAYRKLGFTLKDLGIMDEAVSALRLACQLRPDSAKFHSSLLYCLHFHPDYDSENLAQEHDLWHMRHAEPLASQIQPLDNIPDPGRRLRVGYVSPHFRDHPIGRFLLPLFETHDRRRYEIYCYASVVGRDNLTKRLKGHSDRWHDIAGLTDENLAGLIREDQIDILVDLDAHMPENRLLTFAHKPAPVQVTYLAYCSTTGLRTMDYRLTDPFLDPVGLPQSYAEESVRLPETYWCYQPHTELPPVGPLSALASGHVTFGCLNNFWKVTLPTLTAWRDLLQRVPGSRLLLHASLGTHRDRVRTFFAEDGVDPARLEFVGVSLPAQYFERYHQIDIGLDPFPYPGGTTTCDALWMGVPVVSLAGTSAISRGGLSILSNVGLSELVARTADEYARIAANLAGDLPRLAALRAGLRDRLQNSPLTDAPRFARHVEAAFRAMWQRWCHQTNRGVAGTANLSR